MKTFEFWENFQLLLIFEIFIIEKSALIELIGLALTGLPANMTLFVDMMLWCLDTVHMHSFNILLYFVTFCCGLTLFHFTHILQGYFTGTGTIMQSMK